MNIWCYIYNVTLYTYIIVLATSCPLHEVFFDVFLVAPIKTMYCLGVDRRPNSTCA